MPRLNVTNLSSAAAVQLLDPSGFDQTATVLQVAASGSGHIDVDSMTLERMSGVLGDLVTRGLISYTITATPTVPVLLQALAPQDFTKVSAVTAASVLSQELVIRAALVAGTGGAADYVTLYAVNNFPAKMRVWGAQLLVLTNVASATVQLTTDAAGSVHLSSAMSAASPGLVTDTSTDASILITPGATVGLFAQRSDNTLAGEVILHGRLEQ